MGNPAETGRTCPKCSGAMEKVYLGYLVLDAKIGPSLPIRCVKGDHGKSFWRGKKTVDIKHQYDLDSFRCAACGFLESYAIDKVEEDIGAI